MKKYLILILTLTCFAFSHAQAQSTVAKLKYEDAEKAFYDADYQSCISLLDETEKLLGKSAPNILHLRTMAESNIWEADPYGSFEQLEKLRQLCNQYLKNYDIKGLEGKYREVYDLRDKLPKVNSREEFQQWRTQSIDKENAEKLNKIVTANNLVFVEGGTYMMGEDKHAHEVTVSDFYIGKYEITYKDWKQYLTSNDKNESVMNYGKNDSYKYWFKDEDVYWFYESLYNNSWDEAMAYCKWLQEQYGGIWRLPTEAEWEYAARGGNKSQGYKYSGSNNWREVAKKRLNNFSNKNLYLSGGQFKPNELGIYDMSGNFSETCYDYWDKEYYSYSPKENPMGPQKGKYRVSRGGSGTGGSESVYGRRKSTSAVITSFRVVYIPDKN